jgi:hypothetical protein
VIYLASPYSHPDPLIMQSRFEVAERVTAQLLNKRVWVYSPIVHCHALATRFNLPRNFEFWRDYNFALLRHASELYVTDMPGWDESKGVAAELNFARQCGIPRRLLDILSKELWTEIIP